MHRIFLWSDVRSAICEIYAAQLMAPNGKTTLNAAVEFRKEMCQRFVKR